MKHNTVINSKKIKEDAESYYNSGLYCSEAIVASIRENFGFDISEDIVKVASGFPVGIGGSKCVCGAVSGGIISLGMVFGRSTPGDEKVNKCMELSAEVHDHFKGKNHVLCCRALTAGHQLGSEEHMAQCTRFTGDIAEKTAQIISRELSITDEASSK